MNTVALTQQEELCHNRNECLYKSVLITAIGACFASVVVFISLFGKANLQASLIWLLVLITIYAARILDSRLFLRDAQSTTRSRQWAIRYATGSFFAALIWASSIWFMFPDGNIRYAALLVIAISAVGAGALASIPYRLKVLLTYLSVLGAGLVVKLLLVPDPFALVLAIYSLTIFAFLVSSGARISADFDELLRMKLASQYANSAMMNVTEDMAKMGYWSLPLGNDKVDVSESLCRLLNLDNTQVKIKDFVDCIHPDDQARAITSLESFQHDETAEEEMQEYRLDNTKYGRERYIRVFAKLIKNADDQTVLSGSFQDVTESRDAEKKIYQMAYFDTLTKLANRAHFLERLDKQFAAASGTDTRFALLYIDIDNFKEVNDSYGHKCGDSYLKNLAEYLNKTLQPKHIVARLGGDEFCILLRDTDSYEAVLEINKEFDHYKSQKLQLGPYAIRPQFSIGVALYPEHGDNPEDLVKHADLAMYNAKNLNDADIALYHESMSAEVSRRLQTESDIREALASNEFELWYQPKVDIQTRQLSGFEALIRWRKNGEVVPPDSFIPIAETVGLINDIGEWVLDHASEQLIVWKNLGFNTNVAVNISSGHFLSEGFLPTMQNLLDTKPVNPADLEIEITESVSRDSEIQADVCRKLKSLGVQIAIDDFGTGYSSLSVLSGLDVDTLKIDRSFVNKIPDCNESGVLVNAIVDLARGLDFSIVAEGVETVEQLNYLESLGCQCAQGYYFSKPLPVAEATKMLEKGSIDRGEQSPPEQNRKAA